MLDLKFIVILAFALLFLVFIIKVAKEVRHEQKLEEKKEKEKEEKQLNTWSRNKFNELISLKKFSLPRPITEQLRPSRLDNIIGQEEGIKALRIALCCSNPMHVIIYGPPGVGKTSAARLIFEEAKRRNNIFSGNFITVDDTIQTIDERGHTDSLIGSVHSPIYQGAKSLLAKNGYPEPLPGAVTHAHGGILFIDEIGELHPQQMNKLLKVLEDGKVLLTSSYYNPFDRNTPEYLRSVFEEGLPADFRLIGATTREPDSLPPALRSRCVEIFFRELTREELVIVALNALNANANILRRYNYADYKQILAEQIASLSKNPREVVNLVNLSIATLEVYGDIPYISNQYNNSFSFKNNSVTL